MSFWTLKTSARLHEEARSRESADDKARMLKPGLENQFDLARKKIDEAEAAQRTFSGQIRDIFDRAGIAQFLDAPMPRDLRIDINEARAVAGLWVHNDGKFEYTMGFRFVEEHFGPVHIEYFCENKSDLGQFGDEAAARTRKKDEVGFGETNRYTDRFMSTSNFDDFNDFLRRKEAAPQWFATMMKNHIG